MDKRFKPISLSAQLMLRKTAIDEILANPQWSLGESVHHLKSTLRLTTAELARLAGVSARTLQEIENGNSQGTVHSMDRIFGVLGLRLGVVRVSPPASADDGG
ncbi:helix-turn-helix domain-containing protein [Lacisediminimonas profundi]|uniref:helix-turn-helix domain-containing protein n=1 Tax=Lacisediminimonas profundi TaxID=2603856 RepID=UPI00124B87B7|nr:helix-turn-helix domain-containing protein [Lacisediminimonas profundi]